VLDYEWIEILAEGSQLGKTMGQKRSIKSLIGLIQERNKSALAVVHRRVVLQISNQTRVLTQGVSFIDVNLGPNGFHGDIQWWRNIVMGTLINATAIWESPRQGFEIMSMICFIVE
jgi:hypothetical protein